jgi:hypothetical protein
MDYYKAFFGVLIQADWFHQIVAGAKPIAGNFLVDME